MKKVLIDKTNISKFLINSKDRRDIREGKVKNLITILQAGEHFSSPFVVNLNQDRWRLIDGNHRHQAILECIKEDPNFQIVLWLAEYKDLTPNEEREVFSLWNKGTVQSSTDFLKAHWETIPLGKEMLRRLTLSDIYADKQHIQIKNLMGGQISAKNHRKFDGGYSGGKEQIVYDFQALTLNDIDLVEEFVKFMEKCFGKFHKDNNSTFYGTTPMFVFYRIWYDNQHLDQKKLEKAFIKLFKSNPSNWDNWIKSGGRGACKSFYGVAISSLNSTYSNIHFRNDDEAIEQHEKEQSAINLVTQR